ncbi:MAG: Gfo/Idh/MocA family oxidoreductase [Planctomycetota bacterium]
MLSKRIGFVDYRLDNFHADVYLSALRGPLAHRGYEVAGATAIDTVVSADWADGHDLPFYVELAELADQVDCFVVLAPSNPELHLGLCRDVFPFGKQTFVDKTFAPSIQIAKEIFALADQHGIAIQSTSALRASAVPEAASRGDSPLLGMFITSSGPSFEEYGIHPVELAVSCLGAEVEGLMRLGSDDHPRFVLNFSGQRTAIIDFNQRGEVPFAATLVDAKGYRHVVVDDQSLFVDAAASILDFFDHGEALIDRSETLAVRRILDVALQAELTGKFLDLSGKTGPSNPVPAPHWVGKKVQQS